MMKRQRGDAGAGMLAIMAIMMLGYWLFSGHDSGHGRGGGGGGGGHQHMMGAHAEQSVPEKTASDKAQAATDPSAGH